MSPFVAEFPPDLPDVFAGNMPLDGGRVQSIAVDPLNRDVWVIATQFGGLWKTDDAGTSWFHVLSAVFAIDVTFGADGNHLIATLARDTGTVNGGGIWRTVDGGITWAKPPGADPPPSPRVRERISAYGISLAPDEPSRAYVGTDYGVGVSSDGGATWTHHLLESASPVDPDRMQNAAHSVLALPGQRVIALARTGVHRSDDSGNSWRLTRAGNYSEGFKCADVSPANADHVFVVQNTSTLALYEVAADRWTDLPLPAGASRGPFVRVSRAPGAGKAIDIWVGGGVNLRRARAANIAAVKGLHDGDWTALHRAAGLHDDSGYLGLDSDRRPVLYGSDGGVFRPTNADATAWTRAAVAGSGLNSYLMTDLAGTTNTTTFAPTDTYLYFSTQDNGIWASPDGGLSWPQSDCAEGFYIQVQDAAEADTTVTVAYGKVGCEPSSSMFSDAGLLNQRAIPDVDSDGGALTDMSQAFLIGPERWIRLRTPAYASPEVYVSVDNGAHWRHKATVDLETRGPFTISGTAAPIAYAAFRGAQTTADGQPRVGLMRLANLFDSTTRHYDDSDLIYLPAGGSLGVRATEFDWHAVFGVDPANANYILAPDVINGVVRVSHDGGASWATDTSLTKIVTHDGALVFYDDDAYHMQVTEISFDRHSDRVLVGTRDAGVALSDDRGTNWSHIPDSEQMRYVTRFFFRRDKTAVASTYGRGLWTIDFRAHPKPFPFQDYCVSPCIVRPPRKPERYENVDWHDKEVIAFLGGHVNGLALSRQTLKRITVTPGTDYRRYLPAGQEPQAVDIRESPDGIGFRGLPGCAAALKHEGVIRGVVLNAGLVIGVISGRRPFARHPPDEPTVQQPGFTEPPASADHGRARMRPYLMLSSSLSMPGHTVIGGDGTIHLLARGFDPHAEHAEARIVIDGELVEQAAQVASDGTIRTSLRITQLRAGEHAIEMSQRVGRGRRVAASSFVVATGDDFDE